MFFSCENVDKFAIFAAFARINSRSLDLTVINDGSKPVSTGTRASGPTK